MADLLYTLLITIRTAKSVRRRAKMARRAYPSDLTDPEWIILEPLIPPAKTGGRNRTVEMREVVKGIF